MPSIDAIVCLARSKYVDYLGNRRTECDRDWRSSGSAFS
jgi:hypothetical protein